MILVCGWLVQVVCSMEGVSIIGWLFGSGVFIGSTFRSFQYVYIYIYIQTHTHTLLMCMGIKK